MTTGKVRYCNCPEMASAIQVVDGVEVHIGCGLPMAPAYEFYCFCCGALSPTKSAVCPSEESYDHEHSWMKRPKLGDPV